MAFFRRNFRFWRGGNSLAQVINHWLRLAHVVQSVIPLPIPETEVLRLHRELEEDSRFSLNFTVLTLSSCLIATFGLLSNSAAVIIGAMLVAPLMMPLRGLAFAALEGQFRLFSNALTSIVGATAIALGLSASLGLIVALPEYGSEVLARTQPNLIDLGIAVVAGAISGFAKVRKGVSDALAGTAIAVALMPPLCVVGLSLAQGNFGGASGAFLLYVTNLLGITLACMVVFIIRRYADANHALGWTMFLTLVLVVPLGASFFRLVEDARKAQLLKQLALREQEEQLRLTTWEKAIVTKLTNETITVGQDVDNVDIQVDWDATPPRINIALETNKDITKHQVEQVQAFLKEELQREFDMAFWVVAATKITLDTEFPEVAPYPPLPPTANLLDGDEVLQNQELPRAITPYIEKKAP